MNRPKPNRRRYRRVRIPADVHVRCWGDGFRGIVRVMGEGGMFIDTIHPSASGLELELVIEGGGRDRLEGVGKPSEPIRARCVSRYHEPGLGMGVEFLGLEPAGRIRIRELISRYV